MRVLDAVTNEWTVTHPLRTAYYSFISAVIFFLPIITMTVAYVLIIWKLWSSKRPGEALGPELKTYDNVKKRVNVRRHSTEFAVAATDRSAPSSVKMRSDEMGV